MGYQQTHGYSLVIHYSQEPATKLGSASQDQARKYHPESGRKHHHDHAVSLEKRANERSHHQRGALATHLGKKSDLGHDDAQFPSRSGGPMHFE